MLVEEGGETLIACRRLRCVPEEHWQRSSPPNRSTGSGCYKNAVKSRLLSVERPCRNRWHSRSALAHIGKRPPDYVMR